MRRTCSKCGGEEILLAVSWACDGACSRSPAVGWDLSTHEGRMSALETTPCSWLVEWSFDVGQSVWVTSNGAGLVTWGVMSLGDPWQYVDHRVSVHDPYSQHVLGYHLIKVLDANYNPEVP